MILKVSTWETIFFRPDWKPVTLRQIWYKCNRRKNSIKCNIYLYLFINKSVFCTYARAYLIPYYNLLWIINVSQGIVLFTLLDNNRISCHICIVCLILFTYHRWSNHGQVDPVYICYNLIFRAFLVSCLLFIFKHNIIIQLYKISIMN